MTFLFFRDKIALQRGVFLNKFMDQLLFYANLATIILLLITIGSFWFNFFNKRKKLSQIKENLEIELRTLFTCITEDILMYKKVNGSDYSEKFKSKNYSTPILNFLVSSGKIIEIFKKGYIISGYINVFSYVKLIQKVDNEALQRPEKNMVDFYFKERIVPLRNILIDLNKYYKFPDLSVMPKRFLGTDVSLFALEKYKLTKEKEEEVVRVLEDEVGGDVKKLPEDYFG